MTKEVMPLATRQCSHRPNLERELRELGIPFRTCFVEDEPELARRLGVRGSPCLAVDGRIVCVGQPTEGELWELLARHGCTPDASLPGA